MSDESRPATATAPASTLPTQLPAVPTDVTWPAYVTATTGAGTWAVTHYVFHGANMPPELFIWVQLTIPALLGRVAAAWRLHQARGRQ